MANAMSWVEEEDELEDRDGEEGDADQDMDEDRLETITGPINLPTPSLIPTAVAPHSHHSPHLAQPQQGEYRQQPRGANTDLSQSYRWNFLDDEATEEEGGARDSAPQDAPVASLASMWKSSVRPFQHRFANPKYFQELCQIMHSDPDVQAVTRSTSLSSNNEKSNPPWIQLKFNISIFLLIADLAAIHGFNRNFGQLDAPEVKTARVELTKVQMAVKAKLLDDSRSQTPSVGHALAATFGEFPPIHLILTPHLNSSAVY